MIVDGKEEPYDMSKINDRLRQASLQDQKTDETKPTVIDQMISMTVHGKIYMEARTRVENRCFLHVITWNEVKPHLPKLKGVEHLTDQLEKYQDGSYFDASYEGFVHVDQTILTQILTEILTARGARVKRGDAVRLQFLAYRCYGVYFWNGVNVIAAYQEERGDYRALPEEFKIPSQFQMDYWDDIGFIQWSDDGPFCFDIAGLPAPVPKQQEFIRNDYGVITYCAFSIDKIPWCIFIQRNPDDDLEEQNELDQFLERGRCFGNSHWDRLQVENKEQWEQALKRHGIEHCNFIILVDY